MELVVGIIDTTDGAHVGVWEFFVAVDVPVDGLPGAAGVGVFAAGPGLDDGELEVAGSGGGAAGFEAFDGGSGLGVEGDCCCGAEGCEEEYEGNWGEVHFLQCLNVGRIVELLRTVYSEDSY